MRKSLILASLLFVSSAFSLENCSLTQTSSVDHTPPLGYTSTPPSCSIYTTPKTPSPSMFTVGSGGPICSNFTFNCDFVTVCPVGKTDVGGMCSEPPCASPNIMSDGGNCVAPLSEAIASTGLHAYDGDPVGCGSAGGYYMTSAKCNTLGEAVADVFRDPQAIVGAMLTVGGVTFAGTGLVAALALGATPVGAVTFGAYAAGTGLVMGLMALGDALASSSPITSTDITTGETRMKVNLTSSGGASSSTSGSDVTSANITTGKVEQSVFVPTTVQSAMADPVNIDKDTGTIINPISTAGIQTTTYDYSTNVATTVTHSSSSTSAVPVTTSASTSFTVVQNVDGTVTTTPTDTTVAPTVSGSGGGFVVSSPTGTGTTTGTTTGTGEYAQVLNDIKNNTSSTNSILDNISSFLSAGTNSNSALTDGSDTFSSLDGNLKGSYSGFVYSDPLGLNALGGTGGIQSYGFTLYGRHFVVLDQSMIDQLPIEMIRGLFLFIAAVLGLMTVLSGV